MFLIINKGRRGIFLNLENLCYRKGTLSSKSALSAIQLKAN